MATIQSVTASPNPAPAGQPSRIQVNFNLAAAVSDLTADVTVYENGAPRGSAAGVVLKGTPAETAPNVTVGSTGVGWEIRTSAGTLSALGGGAFNLTR